MFKIPFYTQHQAKRSDITPNLFQSNLNNFFIEFLFSSSQTSNKIKYNAKVGKIPVAAIIMLWC